MSKKIYIDTLGCEKNEYDSQNLAAQLLNRGCTLATSPEEADILIVNTCGFIEAAKVESIEHIFNMAALKGEHKKLVVTGCLSERYHEDLAKEMPEVDLFTGVNDYDDLPGLLLEEADGDQVHGEVEKILPYRKRVFPAGTYTASLKIAEGCNNTCAFCAIPKIRGPYRSKRMEDCVREAEDMAKAGIRELVVIAQDTSSYGEDLYGKKMLPELLRKLCQVDGIEWIRLMYVYDDGITDELIETIREEEKICNYIDIPIQHVADPVLKRMRRKSSGASIRETIQKLRREIPDIHIRTTILVGFPGETEEDFQKLLEFAEEMRIPRLGAFAFSDEEGTLAFNMDEKLDEETKNERVEELMRLQSGISESLNEEKVGRTFQVMVDEVVPTESGACDRYLGRTRFDALDIDDAVEFTALDAHAPGDIVCVRITDSSEYDLYGEEVSNEFTK
ncbi:MAG: 30S ribosomal protein S12 methylthiotransferase RimO [Eubacteriales bacterium]|nr:30S ribosomal protein S12 methylthiotransferase RimO [Eubacteriales bacterium]